MSVKVNLRGVGQARELARKAELMFAPGGYLNHGIEEILQRAANEERASHDYQNQTGHLQQSTAARVIEETDDNFLAHLEMGEEYASFVVGRGYSRFDEIAKKAKREVDAHVASVGKKLARK